MRSLMQEPAAAKNVGTRDKLVATARTLFAERGVDGVSLREISRGAGQGNVSALQYHFGDRESLLGAVLEPQNREVHACRTALLEQSPTSQETKNLLTESRKRRSAKN